MPEPEDIETASEHGAASFEVSSWGMPATACSAWVCIAILSNNASRSSASPAPGDGFSAAVAVMSDSRLFHFFENLAQLFPERGGCERLDHVAAGTGLSRRDDVLLLRFRSNHQHRELAQCAIRTDILEHGQPVHVRHVPVGYDEIEVTAT